MRTSHVAIAAHSYAFFAAGMLSWLDKVCGVPSQEIRRSPPQRSATPLTLLSGRSPIVSCRCALFASQSCLLVWWRPWRQQCCWRWRRRWWWWRSWCGVGALLRAADSQVSSSNRLAACASYLVTSTSHPLHNRVTCHAHVAPCLGCQGDVGPKHPEARSRSIVAAVVAYWRNRCCTPLSTHLPLDTIIPPVHLRMLDPCVTPKYKLVGPFILFQHQLQMLAYCCHQ